VNVLKLNQRATVYTLLERSSTQREIARITGIQLGTAGGEQVTVGGEKIRRTNGQPWKIVLKKRNS
jgi:IS4 transposase